jgi:hypothetical protein
MYILKKENIKTTQLVPIYSVTQTIRLALYWIDSCGTTYINAAVIKCKKKTNNYIIIIIIILLLIIIVFSMCIYHGRR